jgi:hypothetical protein
MVAKPLVPQLVGYQPALKEAHGGHGLVLHAATKRRHGVTVRWISTATACRIFSAAQKMGAFITCGIPGRSEEPQISQR